MDERLIKLEAEGVEQEIAIEQEAIVVNKPAGEIEITANGNYDVGQYATAEVAVAKPTATISITENGEYDVENYKAAEVQTTSGEVSITENGTFDVDKYQTAKVQTTSGTVEITSNGTVDVDKYQTANVNVPMEFVSSSQGGTMGWEDTATVNEVLGGFFCQTDAEAEDTKNWTIANNRWGYGATNDTGICRFAPFADLSGYTSFPKMHQILGLLAIPKYDTSNITDFSSAFTKCYSLVYFPNFDVSNATTLTGMFTNCYSIRGDIVLNSVKATNLSFLFDYNSTSAGLYVNSLTVDVSSATTLERLHYGAGNYDCLTKKIILTGDNNGVCTNAEGAFGMNNHLEVLDLSPLDLTALTSYSNMLQTSSSLTYRTPFTCKIYVKDQNSLDWLNEKFPLYTNVEIGSYSE